MTPKIAWPVLYATKNQEIAEMRILITGGAGFIGSRLSRRLIDSGHSVRILDYLDPQIHGEDADPSKIIAPEAEFVFGDVRDDVALGKALDGVEAVFHLAAGTGVGQSMYRINEYVDCNVGGTSVLLDRIARDRGTVRQIIIASSRAVYGEGAYNCPDCGTVYPEPRSVERMDLGKWEAVCPHCGMEVEQIPTGEDKPLMPSSVYAVTKRTQEDLSLCIGTAYGIPVTVLRFFNVYGSGQALGNPYTGIITIFASKIRNGEAPLIYEDGLESRDFVHVSDVAKACALTLGNEKAYGRIFNVGSGVPLSVLDMARLMVRRMGAELEPKVIGKYRVGDIRHCYADLRNSREDLGYEPDITFEDGIQEFLDWFALSDSSDKLDVATDELKQRGLFR
jgi:dTDP-L-rhamnose 4-epimerase